MAIRIASIIPWVLIAIAITFFVWRSLRSDKYELDRRVARARVPVIWTPQWVSVLVALYLGAYGLYLYLDDKRIMNIAMPFWLGVCSYMHFHVRPKRKREFEARLRACHDRICPQCLFSLEGSPPDGTCPECGTAYTNASLHEAWTFLHYDQVKKQFSPTLSDDRPSDGMGS